ncbi:MFS transporter [Nocardioides mangrovicus]|uniref:MFS transporter n=1 Tax=Nocardioides mangrovicus TaxID=2478913 RepID=A0A3L8P1C6_9ACTN|nr:MFS transporter [Nocardioides mangrovicus]RLV48757.1 MFS transporter [Nocardioides mangrovicus]
MTEEPLSRSEHRGRLTLAAVTIGSGIAILDGSVVNIAIRSIGEDLHASLAQLQWVVNGYLLALASLILVGGALGDRHGRRRVYVIGMVGFAACSLLCSVAQNPDQLVGARVLQGVFAALLTPGALAIIESSFRREERAAAIGTWAGVSGITTALGPFVGGYLLDHGGWRWIFLINLPLCLVVVVLCRWVPESCAEDEGETPPHFDVRGAVLGVVALGLVTYALTAGRAGDPVVVWTTGLVGAVAAVAFVLAERHPGAMAPAALFTSRVFSAANLMTFLVYGALGSVFFLLVLQLQVTAGFSAFEAGLATLPLTIVMLLLSSRFAALAARTGPRLPMSLGPLVCAAGVLLLLGVGAGTSYWTGVLPGMLVFALGLSGLVSPLTAAVLAAAPDRYAGAASGVNNAVSRAGSLLAVAALPAAVGLSGADYQRPEVLTHGFQRGMVVCAVLLVLGGTVSFVGLRRLPDDVADATREDA